MAIPGRGQASGPCANLNGGLPNGELTQKDGKRGITWRQAPSATTTTTNNGAPLGPPPWPAYEPRVSPRIRCSFADCRGIFAAKLGHNARLGVRFSPLPPRRFRWEGPHLWRSVVRHCPLNRWASPLVHLSELKENGPLTCDLLPGQRPPPQCGQSWTCFAGDRC